MYRWLLLAILSLALAGPAAAAGLSGLYVEARTCDVWTGACYGNAEMNLTGKNGVMAWKVEKGTLDGVRLDGLGIVAVVAASDTLGLEQTGPARAVLIVDERADEVQRKALVRLARERGGDLLRRVVAVETAPVQLTIEEGKKDVARLQAGPAAITTRAIDKVRDRICGSEGNYYPPLSRGVKAEAAVAVEHNFTGKALRQTWQDHERRSAYVGRFTAP
jgi:hypothetical protein